MRVIAKAGLQPVGRIVVAASLAAAFVFVGNVTGARPVSLAAPARGVRADASCALNSPGGLIKHVIYIQFDNVHYSRTFPNVPSDIEQMPNLLNFMKNNGTFLTNEHTPLIAHTADDILTSLTGVYGDSQGQPISNSYDYYDSSGIPHYTSSFKYWTDPVGPGDPTYNMITANGRNAPAPWVPYTRAGCNVGAFGTANIELENTSSDIDTVFGVGSPQDQEADSSVPATRTKAVADFEGIAIHCAASSTVCSSANGGVGDNLPQEPHGYHGYNALFGAKYVNPYLTNGGTTVNDLNGNPIQDSSGNPGFPGFDPTAAQTLAYVADMQESGVPITYAYIADTHDNQSGSGGTFGPGEAGYVAQNAAYNTAFGKFFANLKAHGITKRNTLFVVTADEGDHFVGSAPTNPSCDGVTTPCTYSHVGEIDTNMTALLKSEEGITVPFDIHFDSAPNVYINGEPAQTDPTVTRAFERATGRLTATNPITGNTDKLTNFMADQPEMRMLHMMTADSQRNATFTDFGNPDYYFETYDQCPNQPVCEGTGFAWNHGDVGTDINTTFLGFAGPDIKRSGISGSVWTDETDIRPTILALVGLHDDYAHDGRVITEILKKKGLSTSERKSGIWLHYLGAAYKQINACVGELGLDTLAASSKAMESGSPRGDTEYLNFRAQIRKLTEERNVLARKFQKVIEGAEFHGHSVNAKDAQKLIKAAEKILKQGRQMAAHFS